MSSWRRGESSDCGSGWGERGAEEGEVEDREGGGQRGREQVECSLEWERSEYGLLVVVWSVRAVNARTCTPLLR